MWFVIIHIVEDRFMQLWRFFTSLDHIWTKLLFISNWLLNTLLEIQLYV